VGVPVPELDDQCRNWNSAKMGSNIYMLGPKLTPSQFWNWDGHLSQFQNWANLSQFRNWDQK